MLLTFGLPRATLKWAGMKKNSNEQRRRAARPPARASSRFWLLVYRAPSWSELARGRVRTSNAAVPPARVSSHAPACAPARAPARPSAQSWSKPARGRVRTSDAVLPQWCSSAKEVKLWTFGLPRDYIEGEFARGSGSAQAMSWFHSGVRARRKSRFWLLIYRAPSRSELARGRVRTSNAVGLQWCLARMQSRFWLSVYRVQPCCALGWGRVRTSNAVVLPARASSHAPARAPARDSARPFARASARASARPRFHR